MAEFADAIEVAEEVMEDGSSGLEDVDLSEDMSPEEAEEFNEEVQEARESVAELQSDASDFKKFATEYVTKPAKQFSVFVIKNAAIGVILYGVNVTLQALAKSGGSGGSGDASAKKKLEVTSAITKLIQTETDDCKKLKQWMDDHKDETVTLDGIEIPLESVFFKYMGPISDVSYLKFSSYKSVT